MSIKWIATILLLYRTKFMTKYTSQIGDSLSFVPCDFMPSCSCTNRKQLLDVSCYGRSIPQFSAKINISFLQLTLPEIDRIPNRSFMNLDHLKELDLSGNNLKYLEPEAFFGLEKLEQLNLSWNNLSYSMVSFPEVVFKPLESLIVLNVDNNIDLRYGCANFPGKVISFLPNLRRISVDICSYSENGSSFESEFLRLRSLSVLKTGQCVQYKVNNNTFLNTPYLEWIDISWCIIEKYDYDGCAVCRFHHLRYIKINNIQLQFIPKLVLGLSFTPVQTLVLTDAGIREWYFSDFSNLHKSNIKQIYLNQNLIDNFIDWISQPCELPPTLQTLDFSENKLRRFQCKMPNIVYLNFQSNDLGRFLRSNDYLLSNKTKIKDINLSFNDIHELKFSIFHGHHEAEIINLSSNALTDLTFDLSECFSLKILDLSNNTIKGINEKTMAAIDKITPDFKVDLSKNIFQCTCQSLPYLHWMLKNNHRFLRSQTYQCLLDGKVVSLSSLKYTIQLLTKNCTSYTVLITLVAVCVCIASMLSIIGITYRFRWRLRYIYYMTRSKYKRYKALENEGEYKYNAFISYAQDANNFVEEECIPNLETIGRLKICVHHRDFQPGEDILQNMTNAIHESRKTIFIVTRSFLESEFCMWEFNIARMESIYARGGENILFLVFYEQIQSKELSLLMLELIQQQSYIEYPNDEQGNIVFWDKIRETVS